MPKKKILVHPFKYIMTVAAKNNMQRIFRKLVPSFFVNIYRNYRKIIYKKLYEGNGVFCVICQSKFKIFAPFGLIKRQNAKCINCGSLERHRLLYLYLAERTDILNRQNKIHLLHFAPELPSYNVFSNSSHITYFPCDLNPGSFTYKDLKRIQKVDITQIPSEDDFFDIILCNHVLEHVPDDKQAMEELYRILKKDGWGIFQVPIDYNRELTFEDPSIITPKDREKAFGQYDHVRVYGKDYAKRLESAGFKVIQDGFIKKFTTEELFRYGLSSSEIIYKCYKC